MHDTVEGLCIGVSPVRLPSRRGLYLEIFSLFILTPESIERKALGLHANGSHERFPVRDGHA